MEPTYNLLYFTFRCQKGRGIHCPPLGGAVNSSADAAFDRNRIIPIYRSDIFSTMMESFGSTACGLAEVSANLREPLERYRHPVIAVVVLNLHPNVKSTLHLS